MVPCEFIGVVKSQQSVYLKGELVSNHDELMCNFFAQVCMGGGGSIAYAVECGVRARCRCAVVEDGNRWTPPLPPLGLLAPRHSHPK
jgi:hypothetical protein